MKRVYAILFFLVVLCVSHLGWAQFDHPLFTDFQDFSDLIQKGSLSGEEALKGLQDRKGEIRDYVRSQEKGEALTNDMLKMWQDYVLLLCEVNLKSSISSIDFMKSFPDLRVLNIYFPDSNEKNNALHVYRVLIERVFKEFKVDGALFEKHSDYLTENHLRIALAVVISGQGEIFKPKRPFGSFFRFGKTYEGTGGLKGFWNEITRDSNMPSRFIVEELLNPDSNKRAIRKIRKGGIMESVSLDPKNIFDIWPGFDDYGFESKKAKALNARIDNLIEKISSLSAEQLREREEAIRQAKRLRVDLRELIQNHKEVSSREMTLLVKDFNRYVVWAGFINSVDRETNSSIWGSFADAVKFLVGTKSKVFNGKNSLPHGHIAFSYYQLFINNYINPEVPTFRAAHGMESITGAKKERNSLRKSGAAGHQLPYEDYIPIHDVLSALDTPVKSWIAGKLFMLGYGENVLHKDRKTEQLIGMDAENMFLKDVSLTEEQALKREEFMEEIQQKEEAHGKKFITREMLNLIMSIHTETSALLVNGMLSLGFDNIKDVQLTELQQRRKLKSPSFLNEDWLKFINEVQNSSQVEELLKGLKDWKAKNGQITSNTTLDEAGQLKHIQERTSRPPSPDVLLKIVQRAEGSSLKPLMCLRLF